MHRRGDYVLLTVRGLLHAQHRRQAGHHQDHRVRHRRQGLRGRLDRAASRPRRKTGKKVAIVGSGPAGLAAAQQLARVGHEVHVYEKSAKPGGLLVYGIPDFKMEKHIVERRVKQMEAEGVVFHCGVHVGKDVAAERARGRARRGAAGRRLRAAVRFLRQVAGARPRRHPLRHDVPAAAEPARRRRAGGRRGARSPPRASTSSSSAAATRAATASAPRSARAPSR